MDINYDLYKTFYIVANCTTITEASKKLILVLSKQEIMVEL